MSERAKEPLSYKESGVDIAAADAFVARVAVLARETHDAGVVGHASKFAGLYRPSLTGLADPILAATCDGVGTKLMVAREMKQFAFLGQDLVAMSVNDLLPLGARPLLFLDYMVCGKLDPDALGEVVSGIARACKKVGCVLLGGETAEHPGHFAPDDFDLAGFAVGVVDGERLPDPTTVGPSDVVLGLPSSGIHANGFSLARSALLEHGGMKLGAFVESLGRTLGEELLEPTALYVEPVLALHRAVRVKAAAHVTGGGLVGRAAKLVQDSQRIVLDSGTFTTPPIFELIGKCGNVSPDEMARTFNMGLGFLAIVSRADAERALAGGEWLRVGTVEQGDTGVTLV